MRLNISKKINRRMEQERAQLASGSPPPPPIKNRLQRRALRLLTGFMALMLIFTVISRAASAAAAATVTADTAKSGVLTNRAVINGQLEAADDFYFSLPSGLRIESSLVKAGQQVEKGEGILTLDIGEVEEKLESLEYDIEILRLKLSAAQGGVSGNGAEGILSARQALEDAKKEYERLIAKLDRSDERSAEDFADVEEALEKARESYDAVVQKTKESLIKEAERELSSAKEALESMQEAADEATRSAQQMLDQAAKSSNHTAYQKALETYNSKKNALQKAQEILSGLEKDPEADEEALSAARQAVSELQSQTNAAKAELDAISYSSSDYAYALDSYNATVLSWTKKLQKTKDGVSEAQAKLNAVRERKDFTDEAAVIAAQGAIDSALLALKNAERSGEDQAYSREDQIYAAEKNIESAQRALDSALRQAGDSSRSDSLAYIQSQIDALSYKNELEKLLQQEDGLRQALSNGGIITAPISGTILKTLDKGTKTQEGSDTVTISGSDGGHMFTGSLDQNTASKLASGDKGYLSFVHEGKTKQLEVQITGIGSPNEDGMCAVTARLPAGSYPTGASAELTITRKSETYYSCLPLSALRSGSEGDYVLVLREKKTVMGTEWTVEKVPVKVKDRDSELMSIESTLMWDDKVVISASKPISEGDRVRLEG